MAAHVIRFGTYELDLQAAELRKQGVRIKLQVQPFEILALLAQRPGELVTREELRKRLWADGTLVDFDNSLNSSINKIREALCDSADNPRFVETVPRRGYRFIVPVHGVVAGAKANPGLAPGTLVGPFEILSMIGAGAMGEVYRARDARLDRDVAIKLLPTACSENPERLRRFEQEARAAAALSHPNVLAVFDIGSHDGRPYIVSELLQGETLRERLRGGRLPATKVADWALQIAQGLAAAHGHGIIHRDLKPENIFLAVDGRVRILDFGLAKLAGDGMPNAEASGELHATNPGQVLGTPGYIAPEQASGGEVDARSDIFAYGAILYEMLSGQRVFQGLTPADVLSATLTDDPPPISCSGADDSPALELIVRRCLEKNPADRFQSARDVAFDLGSLTRISAIATPAAQRRRGVRSTLPALVLVAALTGSLMLLWRARASGSRAFNLAGRLDLSVPAPEGMAVAGDSQWPEVAVSPDGQKLALVLINVSVPNSPGSPSATAAAPYRRSLWVRELRSNRARKLVDPCADCPTSADDPLRPFWSPDSRWIGFFADRKLKKISLSGGEPEIVCDAFAPRDFKGFFPWASATWSTNGTILFAGLNLASTIYRVADSGGLPLPVTFLDSARGDFTHTFPHFLPDGRHFIFIACNLDPAKSLAFVGSLDSKDVHALLRTRSKTIYSPPGYLLFTSGGAIMAQRFDPSGSALRGNPLQVADSVGDYSISASETGVVVYRGAEPDPARQLVWRGRDGQKISAVGDPGDWMQINLSPDEKRVAIQRYPLGVFLMELSTGVVSRVDSETARADIPLMLGAGDPLWSPDSRRLIYRINHGTHSTYFKQLTLGLSEVKTVYSDKQQEEVVQVLDDWSGDGRFLIFHELPLGGFLHAPAAIASSQPRVQSAFILPLSGERVSRLLTQSRSHQDQFRFSPDGRWVAWNSDESGRGEVYVSAVDGTQKRQVSNYGGVQPVWRSDGKELFYLANRTMMAVSVKPGRVLETEVPRALFESKVVRTGELTEYCVTRDGRRFLLNEQADAPAQQPIHVVLNWDADLK